MIPSSKHVYNVWIGLTALASAVLAAPSRESLYPKQIDNTTVLNSDGSQVMSNVWSLGGTVDNQYVVQLKPNVSMERYQDWITHTVKKQRRLAKRSFFAEISGEPFNTAKGDNITAFAFAYHTDNSDLMAALEGSPDVELIEPNTVMGLTNVEYINGLTGNAGLDRINQRNLPLDGIYDYPASAGSLSDVYILDSGVFGEHAEFLGPQGQRARNGFSSSGILFDDNGHGTHVAGIIGGRTSGVAKGANLIAVKVMDAKGLGSVEEVLRGLQFVQVQAQNTRRLGRKCVINLSIGGKPSQILNSAIDRIVMQSDCAVVVAGGNSDENACNQSPANAPTAIAVGNIDEFDRKHGSSNWGPCISLYAPGTKIRSAGLKNNFDSIVMTGTSMSAPFVAGALARLRTEMPYLNAMQCKQVLVRRATRKAVRNTQVNYFWNMFPWNWGRGMVDSTILYVGP